MGNINRIDIGQRYNRWLNIGTHWPLPGAVGLRYQMQCVCGHIIVVGKSEALQLRPYCSVCRDRDDLTRGRYNPETGLSLYWIHLRNVGALCDEWLTFKVFKAAVGEPQFIGRLEQKGRVLKPGAKWIREADHESAFFEGRQRDIRRRHWMNRLGVVPTMAQEEQMARMAERNRMTFDAFVALVAGKRNFTKRGEQDGPRLQA